MYYNLIEKYFLWHALHKSQRPALILLTFHVMCFCNNSQRSLPQLQNYRLKLQPPFVFWHIWRLLVIRCSGLFGCLNKGWKGLKGEFTRPLKGLKANGMQGNSSLPASWEVPLPSTFRQVRNKVSHQ